VKTYFILNAIERAVKIGRSLDPERRLAQLQTGCAYDLQLLLVIEGNHERQLHQRWQHLRMEGEWFKATDELLLYVYGRCAAQARTREMEIARTTRRDRHVKMKRRAVRPLTARVDARIPWQVHERVLRTTYKRYRSEALPMVSESDVVEEFVTGAVRGQSLCLADHQHYLRCAREYYRSAMNRHLSQVTASHMAGAPRLIRDQVGRTARPSSLTTLNGTIH
jgi:hypothetical protein